MESGGLQLSMRSSNESSRFFSVEAVALPNLSCRHSDLGLEKGVAGTLVPSKQLLLVLATSWSTTV